MTKRIRKIFSEVPKTYELVNHVLTFGLDIVWRRKAARLSASGGGTQWLDICCGTGETAVYLRRFAKNPGVKVVGADFTLQMLRKAVSKPDSSGIAFVLSDARQLPFADASFDLVTLSFATRNINVTRDNLVRCLREFHRVLKPGGRLVNLETSQPRSRATRRLFHAYISLMVRRLGGMISGSKAGYTYLATTIPRFYEAEEFAAIIGQTGFSDVRFDRLFLGTTAIHVGTKE